MAVRKYLSLSGFRATYRHPKSGEEFEVLGNLLTPFDKDAQGPEKNHELKRVADEIEDLVSGSALESFEVLPVLTMEVTEDEDAMNEFGITGCEPANVAEMLAQKERR
jgi:hypothetical protein